MLALRRGLRAEAEITPFLIRPKERPLKVLGQVAIAIVIIAFISKVSVAQEITVAAAADLQSAMQTIVSKFQHDTGKTVKIIYGSSGNFFQQIQNGAPFDMFFSANLDYPRKLEAAGLTETGSYYPYAKGKIVLWVPNDSKIDLKLGLR
ncbi:MAG: molybdate ABC transporter substrate-binding protein, partial [Acidobacteriota bacterium]|nr:molybdate ABC transporter substrate-binding protein [Acidobacteriota bacterium]